MLRAILVALDGSPWSEAATALALDWAGRFEARLLGLGVRHRTGPTRRWPRSSARARAGREAARTLQTFESLGAGEELAVVTVHRDRAEAEAIARLAGDFLTAHDTPHELCPIASEASPAEVLLEEVRRRRPRLLVMGAHGHRPLRGLFATSVTRAVLGACPVPALIGA